LALLDDPDAEYLIYSGEFTTNGISTWLEKYSQSLRPPQKKASAKKPKKDEEPKTPTTGKTSETADATVERKEPEPTESDL